jgi:hypothetical protein
MQRPSNLLLAKYRSDFTGGRIKILSKPPRRVSGSRQDNVNHKYWAGMSVSASRTHRGKGEE